MLNKKKRAKFIDFQKKILTPFCKKGLGQPAKKSLMSGFKDGGGVIVPGYLEFTGAGWSKLQVAGQCRLMQVSAG